MPPKKNQLESLQIIRAFAMILVLLVHLDVFSTRVLNKQFLYGIFSLGGDSGVELFFVLSGFIISYIHLKDVGQISKLWPYLIKRFSRIYPVYWVISLIIIPFYFFFPQYGLGDETQFRTIFYSLLLYPQNHPPIIHSAWSLSYEIFYYLMFGLMILLGFKKILPILTLILSVTVINIIYSLIGITLFKNPVLYIIFNYHSFEFLFGCLSAYLVIRYRFQKTSSLLIAGVVIFSLTILYERYFGFLDNLRLFGYGIPAFLIITAISSKEINQTLKIPKLLFPKLLLLLGNASFSIYLTHQFLISGMGRTLVNLGFDKIFGPLILVSIVGVVTLSIGSIFYLLVEKPILYQSRKKLLSIYRLSKLVSSQ